MAHQTSLITLLIPVYNEANNIAPFLEQIEALALPKGVKLELLFIDDGSQDDSYAIISALTSKKHSIKALRFSRNFGKEIALTAGLDAATGDAVLPMDVDLQDPPQLIPEMIKRWQDGIDVVLAVRKHRDEPFLKRKSAQLFYKLIHKMSSIHIPEQAGDFRLMDRKVVEVIKQLRERSRFMKGLFAWPGFSSDTIYFDRPKRASGEPRQSYRNLFRLAFDGIFSFTTVPLQVWTYIGAIISVTAFIYALFIIFSVLLTGVDVPGYASLLTAVLFIGGIQLISMGIIGEYIARIYREVKQRPLYVIADSIGIHHDGN